MYLCPSSAPKRLARLTPSLITTLYGMSMRAGPAIGALADHVGVRYALLFVAATLLVIVVTARHVAPESVEADEGRRADEDADGRRAPGTPRS